MAPESGAVTQESCVVTSESGAVTQESGVVTSESFAVTSDGVLIQMGMHWFCWVCIGSVGG